LKKAIEISGVKPDEAIHIGDSITSDVEPAKEMGITPTSEHLMVTSHSFISGSISIFTFKLLMTLLYIYQSGV